MNVPDTLRYTESHEWVRAEGDLAVVGITDHAQHEMDDVVFVDPPAVGGTVEAGGRVAVLESVKAASDIYAPVAGEIVARNEKLDSNPELINNDPYGEGWICKIRMADPSQLSALKDAAAYRAQIS